MEACKTPRIIKPPKNRAGVKEWMNNLLHEFNHTDYLRTDPIQFVHAHTERKDQELIALVAALFSFGNVTSIRSTLTQILKPLGASPHHELLSLQDSQIKKLWSQSYYRFYSSRDIQHLFLRLRDLLLQYDSIEAFFSQGQSAVKDPHEGLRHLREWFLTKSTVTPGLRFMFADPEASPSKRWHMWLRWIVRKDEIDLGLWKSVTASQLTIPLDTHVFDMVQHLGLTKSKTPTRKAALEVTDKFREWDANDPVKYDFALCRLGVLGFKKALIS